MVDYRYSEISNIVRFNHIGFPEWFQYKNEKGEEYLISTLDDCAIRYRIEDENFDKLLFFSRGTQTCTIWTPNGANAQIIVINDCMTV